MTMITSEMTIAMTSKFAMSDPPYQT
jgi:hypothetical protein